MWSCRGPATIKTCVAWHVAKNISVAGPPHPSQNGRPMILSDARYRIGRRGSTSADPSHVVKPETQPCTAFSIAVAITDSSDRPEFSFFWSGMSAALVNSSLKLMMTAIQHQKPFTKNSSAVIHPIMQILPPMSCQTTRTVGTAQKVGTPTARLP